MNSHYTIKTDDGAFIHIRYLFHGQGWITVADEIDTGPRAFVGPHPKYLKQ